MEECTKDAGETLIELAPMVNSPSFNRLIFHRAISSYGYLNNYGLNELVNIRFMYRSTDI